MKRDKFPQTPNPPSRRGGPLDVPGIGTSISGAEIVKIVRAGRRRVL